ncbi:putative non-specific serine/threonine protein kinase [Helianthus annuus]|nr:putative non-specific serine/threonine protein kinase [Helianthus annuus]
MFVIDPVLSQGVIHMALYKNANTRWLDMSGNHMLGTIPGDIQKFIPRVEYLNFSSNAFNGVIPSVICDLSELQVLDLSNNKFSGEVPKGLLGVTEIRLSNNILHGEVLRNSSLGSTEILHLDNNCFTGNIGNSTKENSFLTILDISDNHFTGTIPCWISNMLENAELLVRNNNFEGQFPCGKAFFSFLDLSQNSFSGPIPSCLISENIKHRHFGSNKFTGFIPNAFRNLTKVLTLDIGHNYLSGTIPKFIGELYNLRILLLGNNNFTGIIPKRLCQLKDVSLIDLSSNSLSGLIPRCLQNITGPKTLAFIQEQDGLYGIGPSYMYGTVMQPYSMSLFDHVGTRDEAKFTTKSNSQTYKGNILDYMSGFDLSCNKLTGEIPQELGMLTGHIPVNLSNLKNMESLDLSFNSLTGEVPPELIKLNSLAVLNVSYNNLSGRLPEMKAQFSTFTKESYEGNPLLSVVHHWRKIAPLNQR